MASFEWGFTPDLMSAKHPVDETVDQTVATGEHDERSDGPLPADYAECLTIARRMAASKARKTPRSIILETTDESAIEYGRRPIGGRTGQSEYATERTAQVVARIASPIFSTSGTPDMVDIGDDALTILWERVAEGSASWSFWSLGRIVSALVTDAGWGRREGQARREYFGTVASLDDDAVREDAERTAILTAIAVDDGRGSIADFSCAAHSATGNASWGRDGADKCMDCDAVLMGAASDGGAARTQVLSETTNRGTVRKDARGRKRSEAVARETMTAFARWCEGAPLATIAVEMGLKVGTLKVRFSAAGLRKGHNR